MSIPTGFSPSGGYWASGSSTYFLDDGTNALSEFGRVYYEQIMANRPASVIEEEARLEVKAEQFRLELESHERLATAGFGAEKWNKYFGDVGAEPPLPPNIGEILSGPCPIWAGKRVEETHKLVLVPHRVNGAPLTLNSLGELIKTPREGHKTDYRHYNSDVKKEHGDTGSIGSHWVLMTKDVIPGSRGKSYAEQQGLVAGLVGGYVVPLVLDAAVCILLEHVETGVRLFSDAPWTYTRCQEATQGNQLVVGGFAPAGLYVDCSNCGHDDYGMAAARKF